MKKNHDWTALPEGKTTACAFDASLVDRTLDFFDLYYRKWHRVQLQGGEAIPRQGGVIFFGNHAGFNMLDILMTMVAIRKHTASRRLLRGMHHRGIEKIPLVRHFVLNRLGGVVGSPAHARLLLDNGQAILTYPEGGHSSGKHFKDRRNLMPIEQFGAGFIRLAASERVPLIPVATVGCEEAMPTLHVSQRLGKFFDFDNHRYPIVPQSALTLLPSALGLPLHSFHFLLGLPSKIRILIGAPMHVAQEENIDDMRKHLHRQLQTMISHIS